MLFKHSYSVEKSHFQKPSEWSSVRLPMGRSGEVGGGVLGGACSPVKSTQALGTSSKELSLPCIQTFLKEAREGGGYMVLRCLVITVH